MSAEIMSHAESILCAAVEIRDPDERSAYLSEVCGGDAQLRQAVEQLIDGHFRAGAFLERPESALDLTMQLAKVETVGSEIGRYKLLEQIGMGGMGVVFVAEQTEPVRRRVALKVIKPGMDTRQVIARFEAERQALAMMDHPNIAKVLDAGATAAGRPYFVMELVRGMPITEYCDQARLHPRARLELFITVCQAVQHAHQKGIIHRDLKPTNVLVTLHDGVPVAKVIDFGVAKAINQQLTERTVYTAFTEMLGTPLYMSPEQAELSGLDVDTRSDVYSLGVLLYELLTGQTPFDRDTLAKAGLDELRRMIREDEPPRPSHRISTLKADALSTLSVKRGLDQRQFSRVLKGELDWIVMKSLEKDRNRRYETPGAFATDLRRYLNDEPVAASPPSVTYRLRKFLHRRREQAILSAVVAAAAILIVTLVAGNGYSRWQANQARGLRVREALAAAGASIDAGNLEQAEAQIAQAQAMLREGDPLFELESRVETVAALAAGRRKDKQDLQRFLELAADGQDKMGHTEIFNGNRIAAEALDVFGILKDDDWRTAIQQRQFTQPQQLQISETAYITLVMLADYEVRWKSTVESAGRAQKLLDRAAAFHSRTKAFRYVQARVYRIQGSIAAADAENLAYETAEAATAWDYYLPGHTAGWNGDLPQAIRSYEAALRIQPNHFNSLFFMADRLARKEIGRASEGVQLFTGCIALRPEFAWSYLNRGELYQKLGNDDAAEADFTCAIERASNDLERIQFHERKRDFYTETGHFDKAARQHEQILPLREQFFEQRKNEFGPSARETLISMGNLGLAYQRAQKLDKALSLLEEARKTSLRSFGAQDPDTLTITHNLGLAYYDHNEPNRAKPLFEEALQGWKDRLGLEHPNTLSTLELLTTLYLETKELDKARALIRDLQIDRKRVSDAFFADFQARVAVEILAAGLYDEAEPLLRECLATRTRLAPDDWKTFNAQSMLGAALAGLKRWNDAEAELLAGYQGMKDRQEHIPPAGRVRMVQAAERLLQLYEAMQLPEKAEKWRQVAAMESSEAH